MSAARMFSIFFSDGAGSTLLRIGLFTDFSLFSVTVIDVPFG